MEHFLGRLIDVFLGIGFLISGLVAAILCFIIMVSLSPFLLLSKLADDEM